MQTPYTFCELPESALAALPVTFDFIAEPTGDLVHTIVVTEPGAVVVPPRVLEHGPLAVRLTYSDGRTEMRFSPHVNVCAVLRRHRRFAHLTQGQAADAMDWSKNKIYRLETGLAPITVVDLRALLAYYGAADDAEIDALVEVVRARKAAARRREVAQ